MLSVIESNEKANQPVNEKTQSEYLERSESMDDADDEYLDAKRDILLVDDMPDLSDYINDKKQQFYGVISCAASYGNYLFVGNSQGYIRAFELNAVRPTDMKPLFDQKVYENKVTSLDIAPGMRWLVAGYKSGALALWDLTSYKLEKFMPDVHETEVTGAKVYFVGEDKKTEVLIVSAEASGKVKLVEVKDKGYFRGTGYTKTALYERRLKTTVSVCVHRCPEQFDDGFWGEKRLVAFGATSEVVVVSMRPVKEVIRIRRPQMCRKKSVPYLDFGYGLSPGKQEYTVPMLVIAWDCLV